MVSRKSDISARRVSLATLSRAKHSFCRESEARRASLSVLLPAFSGLDPPLSMDGRKELGAMGDASDTINRALGALAFAVPGFGFPDGCTF